MQHYDSGVKPPWGQRCAGPGAADSGSPESQLTRFSQATAEGEQAHWLRREPAGFSQLTRYCTRCW